MIRKANKSFSGGFIKEILVKSLTESLFFLIHVFVI